VVKDAAPPRRRAAALRAVLDDDGLLKRLACMRSTGIPDRRESKAARRLRRLLLHGAASPLEPPIDAAHLDRLRERGLDKTPQTTTPD
jgi:hypothetical protein